MRGVMDLYDRPGSFFADHPRSRRQVATILAGLTVAAALAPAAAGAFRPLPGGVSQYGPKPHGSTIKL